MKNRLNDLLKNTGDIALRRRAFWMISNLNPQKGDKILDVGCGDGFYLFLLSNLNITLKLYGTDYDINALKSAKKNLGKNITLVKSDLMKKLPFKNESFDKVVMSEVLEHLPIDSVGLKEVYRVIKPGGRIVISVPNKNYPFLWDPVNWLLERIFNYHIKSGFFAGIWNQHIRLYEKDNLEDLIKKIGFKKINMVALTHYCLPFNHHLLNLAARVLARSGPTTLKKSISKFSTVNINERKKSPFELVFLFDKLNDYWSGKGSAVSLVVQAIKK